MLDVTRRATAGLAAAAAAAFLGMAAPAGAGAATRPAPAGADTLRLDLADCLALARSVAPSLAAAAAGSDEAAALAAEAGARRRPLLSAGAGYQYASEHMAAELALAPGLPTRSLEFGDGHAAELSLGLAIPVYTGGELSRTAAAAGAGVAAAAAREQAAGLELDRAVRAAHCGALGRLAQRDASRLAVARLSRHLADVGGARALGAATEESEVRAQARLLAARQRLATADAALDSAALALGRLVGRPGAVVLPGGDVGATLLPGEPDSLRGADDRPDLASLGHEASRQRELAAAARGRLLPRVTADLRTRFARPGVDALANDWMAYGTAGVSVDWPLWDAGARRSRARQAEARATLVEAQRRDLAEAVATAIATARAGLRAAAVVEEQAAGRVALQERLLRMVAGRQAQAAASGTEYLDALDDLAQAEAELVLARTRVRLAETALLWALGR